MAISETSLLFAVRNIARHGDTDVFPFPLENHWFYDEENAVVALLKSMDENFDSSIKDYPVVSVKLLAGVGYAGFRAATQIDPVWNAYLLSLVIEIASEIEAARVPSNRGVVFSYRYNPNKEKNTLFDPDLGWGQFHKAALAMANSAEAVLSTDISDFYPRIYHHRLENALKLATKNTEVVRRIMLLLGQLSSGASYGLPVGGHAARILADFLLNRVDRLLLAQKIVFCRFVDDYLIFTQSRKDAQSALLYLSEILLSNEGLTLSRAKTRFMTRAEFERSSPLADPVTVDSKDESEARTFLRLRLRYDPYSATAKEDYGRLVADVEKFDVAKILAGELRKSRIDEVLVRQLVKSLQFLHPVVRDGAVVSLLQNLEVLYPVFPTVAIVLRSMLGDISETVRAELFKTLRDRVREGSYVMLVPTNLAFAVRILAYDQSEETDAILVDLYGRSRTDMMVKRDIILAMTARRAAYWLSDLLKRFSTLTLWERRALVPASYVLGDEGRHWRDRIHDELSPIDRGFMVWAGSKNNGKNWNLPL